MKVIGQRRYHCRNAGCMQNFLIHPCIGRIRALSKMLTFKQRQRHQQRNEGYIVLDLQLPWKTHCWWCRSARVWHCWKSKDRHEHCKCYLWLRESSVPQETMFRNIFGFTEEFSFLEIIRLKFHEAVFNEVTSDKRLWKWEVNLNGFGCRPWCFGAGARKVSRSDALHD